MTTGPTVAARAASLPSKPVEGVLEETTPAALQALRKDGVHVVMLTGDEAARPPRGRVVLSVHPTPPNRRAQESPEPGRQARLESRAEAASRFRTEDDFRMRPNRSYDIRPLPVVGKSMEDETAASRFSGDHSIEGIFLSLEGSSTIAFAGVEAPSA